MKYQIPNKMKLKTKNYKLKTKEGFTLIEILLSLAILSLILGGIAIFIVRTFQANMRTRAMQNAIENTRFAIETINKRVRTGSGLKIIGDNKICFYDTYTGEEDYCYQFNSTSSILEVNSGSSYKTLIGGDNLKVTGTFTGQSEGYAVREYVTTTITLNYNLEGAGSTDPTAKDSVTIRSTASWLGY